jgi:formyl-CoA transferase
MARGDLGAQPDWGRVAWRIANNERVDALIGEWTASQPTGAVVAALRTVDVPCGPVHTIHDILRWAQFAERGVLRPVVHPASGPVPGAAAAAFPIRFSDAATGYDRPAPLPGADTDPLLRAWLGLDSVTIADLRRRGVI